MEKPFQIPASGNNSGGKKRFRMGPDGPNGSGKKWFEMVANANNTAEILIHDIIGCDDCDAKKFIQDLKGLGNVTHIHLRINSPGGSILDGTAIYNALLGHGARITAEVEGIAASQASVIAMAADKIEMPENAFMMIHNAYVCTCGDSEALRRDAELLEKMNKNAIKAYQRHSFKTDDELAQMMNDETWMGGMDALENGFIEECTEAREIKNEINLSNLKPPERVFAMLGTKEPQNPFPNEHACRLENPDKYRKFRRVSRRSATENKVYAVIRGHLKDKDEWEDQAFRYDKDTWPVATARRHCRRHNGRFEAATGENMGACALWNPKDDATLYPHLVANADDLGPIIKMENGVLKWVSNNQPNIQSKEGANMFKLDQNGNLINAKTGEIVLNKNDMMQFAKDAGISVEDYVARRNHEKELEEAKQAGANAETQRRNEITALCDGLDLGQEFINDLIGEGTKEKPGQTLEKARELVITKSKEKMKSIVGTTGGDEEDKQKTGLMNALMVRAGLETDSKKMQEARKSEFSGFGMLALSRYYLEKEIGTRAWRMTAGEVGQAAIEMIYKNPHMSMGMNVNDLASALSNVNDQSLLKGYTEAPTTFQLVSGPGDLADIKTAEFYKTSEAPDVLEIPDGQPPKLSKFIDKKETGKLVKWGVAWSVTEEMIINDRLDIITRMPEKYGRSLAREKNYQYWYNLLTGNGPTLNEDSLAIFDSTHGNAAAVGADISETTLGAAFTAFMNYALISPDSGQSRTQFLSLAPRYIAVGPNKALKANKYTSSVYTPAANNNELNVFGPEGMWRLTPVIEPLVQSIGTNNWFLIGSPMDMDYAKVYTLRGREQPTVSSRVGGAGQVKGIIYDVEHYFLVKFLDWRGFYKNSGA